MQFPSGIEVDRVDEEVGMDVLPVCMSADQNFIAFVVLSQPPRGFVGLLWIDRFVFWEALHHVVEQHAIRFVI